jgi:hypothetical protein
MTTMLRSDDGSVRVLVVRSPGDSGLLEQLRTWIPDADNRTLWSYLDTDGQWRDTPWDVTPMFVAGVCGDSGDYSAIRRDGADGMVSQRSLGKVLRDDEGLRAELGDDGDPLVLVGVGGETPPLSAFADEMVDGGYSRTMYRMLGEISFTTPGVLTLLGRGFEELDAIQPEPGDFVSYPHVTLDGVVCGQVLPQPAIGRHGPPVRVDMNAPWPKGTWRVDGHGHLGTGLAFAMATGRPHVRGDVLLLRDGKWHGRSMPATSS